MEDIFDAISLYKSTDDATKINAGDAAERIKSSKSKGDWCICRFVKKSPVGFPLHWLDDKDSISRTWTGPLGWSDHSPVAFFTQEEANQVIAESQTSPHYIDRAVHKKDITWRVLLTSSYDSSRVEVYRGSDYAQAVMKKAEMNLLVEAAHHFYLDARLEGATKII